MWRGARAWLSGIVAIAAIAAVLWLAIGRRASTSAPGAARVDGGHPPHIPQRAAAPPPAPPDRPPPAPAPGAAEEDASAGDAGGDELAAGGTWEAVDLEAVRRAMPDNLYWKLGAPTKDPAVEEERDAERDRRNVEYGKVLSGNASEAEIRAYYDYRARVAGDYVEFATYLLDHYQDSLPERDVGLLQLARRLNLARLEEIPRKVEEAYERKQAQDAAREQWLADQKDFGGDDAAAAPDNP